jgi:hypothetical protein
MKVLKVFLVSILVSVSALAQAYTVFEENGKAGLKDEVGKIIIPAKYDAIGWSNGDFSVVNNLTGYFINKRWGLINLNNQKITKDLYEEITPAEGGLFVVRKKIIHSPRLTAGCIDSSGKEIIPFQYDGISISSLRAVVFTQIGNQYRHGLVDLENKTLIPQQYQDVRSIGTLRYAVRNFEGKIALFTENGKQITNFTIDSLSAFKKNYAIVYQDNLKGVVDRDGSLKLPSKYRDIRIDESGKVFAREVDEWIFLTGDNTAIQQVRADSVTTAGEHLLKIKTLDEVRLTDEKLKLVVDSKFNGIGQFERGKAIYKLGHFFGVISKNGSVVLPAMYHQIVTGKEYFLANQRNGNRDGWILFDSVGTRKISRTYEAMVPIASGFAVRSRGFWGVLNSSGKEVIACAYDSLLQEEEGHFVVKFKGMYGVIDANESWKVTPRNNKIVIINRDRFVEYTPSSGQLKTMAGSVIYFTTNKFDVHTHYLLEYLSNGDVWKVDMNGLISERQIIPKEPTEKIFEESEGYRAIKRNGRYGFIDARGRLRIANRYESVQKFSEGYAAVKILGKWGFINLQDNIAVQPVYEEVWPFQNGFAQVKQKGLYGLIDKSGKQILMVRYEKIRILPGGKLIIQQNGLKGLADNSGKLLIHPKYNVLDDAGNSFVIVSRDNKYGVITYQGLSTIPMLYDFIQYDPVHQRFVALRKSNWVEIAL